MVDIVVRMASVISAMCLNGCVSRWMLNGKAALEGTYSLTESSSAITEADDIANLADIEDMMPKPQRFGYWSQTEPCSGSGK